VYSETMLEPGPAMSNNGALQCWMLCSNECKNGHCQWQCNWLL